MRGTAHIDSLGGGALDLDVHRSEVAPANPSPPPGPIVAAIPARYGSTRLPAKPLARVGGKALIEHVYRRAEEAGLDRVVVLTDDPRIGEAVAAFGGEWEMTPAECASGTDRIAWAARGWDADAVINVQGDWILDPALIRALSEHLRSHPEEEMATLAVPASEADLDEPSVVKVVLDLGGHALYFSRAPIPFPRQPGGPRPLKHLGLYGYRRHTLLALAGLPQTPLEVSESLEQLRALENGIRIRVLVVEGEALGIDTPDDLEAARARLAGAGPASEAAA